MLIWLLGNVNVKDLEVGPTICSPVSSPTKDNTLVDFRKLQTTPAIDPEAPLASTVNCQ